MSDVVLDASVFLAILRDEPFDRHVLDVLEGASMSTVNVAEVFSTLSDLGLQDSPRVNALFDLLGGIVPFSEAQAYAAGRLRPLTRTHGMSLGDRACLALALELGAEVYTADRAWARLEVGVRIRLIR